MSSNAVRYRSVNVFFLCLLVFTYFDSLRHNMLALDDIFLYHILTKINLLVKCQSIADINWLSLQGK